MTFICRAFTWASAAITKIVHGEPNDWEADDSLMSDTVPW